MKNDMTQFLRHGVCTLLFAASCTGVLGDVDESLVSIEAVSQQDQQNALLIHDQEALDILNQRFDMGKLLGQVGQYENSLAKNTTRTAGQWVSQIFTMAQKQQDDYQDFTVDRDEETMGAPAAADRNMERVLEQWTDRDCNQIHKSDPNFDAIKAIDDPLALKSKTFRLLGVVNRMDLAGDYDVRITNEATAVPRFLGEVHLVYGLIDRTSNYENSSCSDGNVSNGNAYPMTFVISYRLPVLKARNSSAALGAAAYRLDEDTSLISLGGDDDIWRDKAWIWANAWAHLSQFDSENGLADEAKKLLNLAVRPENFLSLKTNTKVTNNEFELREWYVFGTGAVRSPDDADGRLIPRKLRREPYPCLNNSMTVTRQVNHYWKPGANDLDMVSRKYNLGTDVERGIDGDEERAGYGLMRDNHRPLVTDLGVARENESTVGEDTPLASNYFWNSRCGRTAEEMEFLMHTGRKRNQPPTGDQEVDRLMQLTPFARVKNQGRIWRLKAIEMPNDNDELKESKRHAFAIRTCSGCHSQEGSTTGFHIFPRRAGYSSRLSDFLTGGGRFSYSNTNYEYDALDDRRRVLNRFLRKDQGLYQALKLPERH